MKKYTCVLVEDQIPHIEMMHDKMARLFPEVEVLATASTVTTAIIAIKQYDPVFIVLDVELGDRLGFEVLDALSDMRFKTLFVSSYNKYMRKAFLASAVDFLEKPCSDEDWISAVKRTLHQAGSEMVKVKLDRVLQFIDDPIVLNARLRLINAEGTHPVPLKDIIFVEAQGNRTVFWLTNNRSIKVSHVLREYDDLLDRYNFIRIQRSFIINMVHIAVYKRNGDLEMIGYGERELAISREYRAEFDERYRDFTIGE